MIHNHEVAGSSPALATKEGRFRKGRLFLFHLGSSVGQSVPIFNREGHNTYDVIGEQLGHSDLVSTAFYVDSLGLNRVTQINEGLVKKRRKRLPENLSENEDEPED